MNLASRAGVLGLCLSLFWCGRADAQGMSRGGYGPGMENLVPGRGGTGYLPAAGGFLPFTPGPGGGLGVQSRSTGPRPDASSRSMTMPGAAALGVGGGSGRLSPMAPISGLGSGMGGMRSSRLISRPGMGAATTPAAARPPVGFYPFRVPPALGGPAGEAPGMSM